MVQTGKRPAIQNKSGLFCKKNPTKSPMLLSKSGEKRKKNRRNPSRQDQPTGKESKIRTRQTMIYSTYRTAQINRLRLAPNGSIREPRARKRGIPSQVVVGKRSRDRRNETTPVCKFKVTTEQDSLVRWRRDIVT